MRWRTAITTTALTLLSALSGAQTPSSAPQSQADTNAASSGDDLRDLNALTFSCPKAALNAAARQAAKVHTRGSYQFAYFNIISESHHARYEVYFTSNYEDEPDLKYCVVLYCQQGWDPAAHLSVTLLSGPSHSTSTASHAESCSEPAVPHAKHQAAKR